MQKLLKFEYIYAILNAVVLSIALFTFKDKEVINLILGAIIASSSSIVTYFFTKYDPSKKEDE